MIILLELQSFVKSLGEDGRTDARSTTRPAGSPVGEIILGMHILPWTSKSAACLSEESETSVPRRQYSCMTILTGSPPLEQGPLEQSDMLTLHERRCDGSVSVEHGDDGRKCMAL